MLKNGRFKVCAIYGYYENGKWKPSPLLKMTKKEQLAANKENNIDFKVFINEYPTWLISIV